MQWFIIVLVALVAVVSADETYTNKWDGVATHPIIDNTRLFTHYHKCVLEDSDKGCPPEALALKERLQEALENLCAKCSLVQQEKIKDTLQYMCEKRPESFKSILAKIDPKGEYRPKFEEKYGKINGC